MTPEFTIALVACSALGCIIGLLLGYSLGQDNGREHILSLWRKCDLDTALSMTERQQSAEKSTNDLPPR